VRPAVTATTAGAGNVPVSMLEDFVSTVLSILAVLIPIIIGSVLILVISLIGWRYWRRHKSSDLQTAA